MPHLSNTPRSCSPGIEQEDWAKEEAHDVGERRAVDLDDMEDEEQPQSTPQAAMNADGSRMYPPVLFVHMPLDVDTKVKVEANIALLRSKGVGVGELLLKQRPVRIFGPNRTLTDDVSASTMNEEQTVCGRGGHTPKATGGSAQCTLGLGAGRLFPHKPSWGLLADARDWCRARHAR